MKKLILLMMMTLLFVACSKTPTEEAHEDMEEVVEEMTASSIDKDLKRFIENTLSFDNKYVISSSKRNEFNPHGLFNYMIISNPGNKLSFLATTHGDIGPGTVRKAAYDGAYYEITYVDGSEVVEEVEAFTLDNIVIDIGPSLTYNDIFELLNEENIKSFDVNEDEGITTYHLELRNHDVLDNVGDGTVSFLETVPNSAIQDRKLVVTVKDEKIVTWDYSVKVDYEGRVDTVDASIIIKDNVEEYIERQIEDYQMSGRELPWFLENYPE